MIYLPAAFRFTGVPVSCQLGVQTPGVDICSELLRGFDD